MIASVDLPLTSLRAPCTFGARAVRAGRQTSLCRWRVRVRGARRRRERRPSCFNQGTYSFWEMTAAGAKAVRVAFAD